MNGYVGVIAFLDGAVLLVQQPDFFTGELLWTLPSGGMEDGETPSAAAVRELAEESGCRIDPDDLEQVAITDVDQDGQQLSRSWTFTAVTGDPHLQPADPDEEIVDARWFDRDEAIVRLSRHRYDPIREPAVRFLASNDRGLHWRFSLTDTTAIGPVFRWDPPNAST